MTNNNRNRNRHNPVKAAAQDDIVTFEHKGITYAIETADRWSLETLEAFEDGKVIKAAREILGEVAWTRYKATKPRGAEFGELLTAISEAVGIQGN